MPIHTFNINPKTGGIEVIRAPIIGPVLDAADKLLDKILGTGLNSIDNVDRLSSKVFNLADTTVDSVGGVIKEAPRLAGNIGNLVDPLYIGGFMALAILVLIVLK